MLELIRGPAKRIELYAHNLDREYQSAGRSEKAGQVGNSAPAQMRLLEVSQNIRRFKLKSRVRKLEDETRILRPVQEMRVKSRWWGEF